MRYGDCLFGIRQHTGWSLRETARKLGISATYLREIEMNLKLPSYELEKRINDLYHFCILKADNVEIKMNYVFKRD